LREVAFFGVTNQRLDFDIVDRPLFDELVLVESCGDFFYFGFAQSVLIRLPLLLAFLGFVFAFAFACIIDAVIV